MSSRIRCLNVESFLREHLSIGYIKILGNNSSVDSLLQKRIERFVCSSNLFAESYVLLVSYVIKMSKNGLDYKHMI